MSLSWQIPASTTNMPQRFFISTNSFVFLKSTKSCPYLIFVTIDSDVDHVNPAAPNLEGAIDLDVINALDVAIAPKLGVFASMDTCAIDCPANQEDSIFMGPYGKLRLKLV